MTESVRNQPIGPFGATVRVYDNGYGFFSIDVKEFKKHLQNVKETYEKNGKDERDTGKVEMLTDIITWLEGVERANGQH